jgi:DNA recombination protein RmuC
MNTITSHFDDIGGALARAIIAFNKAVGSLESRVLPSVRKFKELGVTGGDEIPDIKQIDQTPRDRTFVKTNTDED